MKSVKIRSISVIRVLKSDFSERSDFLVFLSDLSDLVVILIPLFISNFS